MSFPVMLLSPTASYSIEGSEMYRIPQFSVFSSHFQVTSGQMTSLPGHFRSPGHVTSFLVTWLPSPASCSLVESGMYRIRQFSAFYSHFQVTFSQMTSLPGHFPHLRPRERHFQSRDSPPAIHSLVGNEMLRIRPFSAFYRHFQVTSGQMTFLSGHFRSPEVTWRHFPSHDCLLLRAIAL